MLGTKKAGHLALIGVVVMFAYQVVGIIRSTMALGEYSEGWLDSTSATSTPSTLAAAIKKKKRNLARGVVNKAYESTYIIFDEACPKGEPFLQCVARLHASPLPPPAGYQNTTNSTLDEKSSDPSSDYMYPWWFETMLRDAHSKKSGLFGQWHFVRIENPPMTFCSLEKVACTEWRAVGCNLNKKMGPKNCQPPTENKPSQDAPKAVFLRDPLERFLSAFMDKCVNAHNRNKEQHCEPKSIYRSDLMDRTNETLENLVEELLIDPRVMFEAYVDTLPLKWNLHFFPESLNCNGLFREIQNYDFVGHMGEDFYADLQAIGQRYGDNVTQQIENSFKVNLRDENITRMAHLPNRERKAANRLEEFYNPRTLRRVLEYMSIDYVKLGLPIPEWAEEMLQKEHAIFEEDDGE